MDINMYGYTVFHDKIINTLISGVHNGTASHAYIFEGPAGMYKHEAARLFANALVCEHPQSSPCGECRSCVEARAGTNPDIITVEHDKGADGKPKKSIGAESARKTVNSTYIKPFNSKRKIYIIPDAENMTVEAQNTFLKTLEEPPEYVVFIIIVPSAENLLQTVVSRSEVISFTPVSAEKIKDYIKDRYPQETDRLEFLSRASGGIPGEADKIIADKDFERLRAEALQYLPKLLSGKISCAFEIEDFSVKNAERINEIIDIWISYIRDLIALHYRADDAIINSDKSDALRKLCHEIDTKKYMDAVKRLVESKNMLQKSVKLSAVMLRCALCL